MKKPPKEDIVYLTHMLECIEAIEKYIGNDRLQFMENAMARDATLRQLSIMSESSTKLSESLKNEFPEVEWRKLGAFRNILVHDYLGDLRHDIIWQNIQNHLPNLKEVILKAIKKTGK